MSFQEIRDRTSAYLSPEALDFVEGAYRFAADSHIGQRRMSGEPYFTHPEQVALILADLRLDSISIAAGLLHDVPEDCGVPVAEIAQQFGPEVAHLVDGVTKLEKVTTIAKESRSGADENVQAENLRKMLIAMAEDIRVVLIKLADRLHNMRTLQALPDERQRAIAQETMEIYAPLASRLGIWQLKWELEDLAFSYLEPQRYREIAKLLATRRAVREEYIRQVADIVRQALAENGIKAEVSGRPKHIYSIGRKIKKYADIGRDFSEIYDLLALRVLVPSVPECYHAMGIIHNLWHPIPGQFDDYIANPKESMYQSLHTTVISLGGKPLEIQIRTQEMHRVAEYGIAAHWRYKEAARKADIKFEERVTWLRQLMEWQKEVTGAKDFVESVKTDLFRDQVFVYTPKGEIKDLPAGATPLDFAYRIHTNIGHRCVGAKVNGRLVSLNTPLSNGDIVEIISAKTERGPSLDWLNPNLGYVKTTTAREKIRQWFHKRERTENVDRGREQLDKELKRLALHKPIDEIAKLFKFDRVDDFLVAIAVGEVNPSQIAVKIAAAEPKPLVIEQAETQLKRPTAATSSSSAIDVMGVGDLLSTLARCCGPVPGDQIVGFITRSRGVSIHRSDCANIRNPSDPNRIIQVSWSGVRDQLFPVKVRLDAWDRVGLLRDVSSVVSEEKLSMTSVTTQSNTDQTATITMGLETTGIEQLSRILGKLENVRGVIGASRAG